MAVPRTLNRCVQFLRYGGVGGLMVSLLLLIGSLVPTKWHYTAQSDCGYPIYVSNVNHFHAELIVPVTNAAFDWRSHLNLAQLGPHPNTYRYLSFGWGDRAFFMNSSFDPITLFDVLFLPGPTVMHVWAQTREPRQLGSGFAVKQIRLSRAEYLKLMAFIEANFQRSPKGAMQWIRNGLYSDSGFYEAKGAYSILRTCNTWTADALRQVGVNTPVWSALAPPVLHQAKSNCDASL